MPPRRSRPGPHPNPPRDIAARRLPFKRLTGPCFRIYGPAHDPLFFGTTGDNRFDAPAGEYGVLYVARDEFGAFIETFGHATGTRSVTMSELRERGLARIEFARSLRLVDLTAHGLARLGADERLCAGSHRAAQRWSLALHEHPDAPDGIFYRARHDPARFSAALFERVGAVVQAVPLGRLADAAHQPLLARILDKYSFGLI